MPRILRIPSQLRIQLPNFEVDESDLSDPEDEINTFEDDDVVQLEVAITSSSAVGGVTVVPVLVAVDIKTRAMLRREEDFGVCRAVVDGFPVIIKFVITCDPRRYPR